MHAATIARRALPALFILYFGTFGLMLSGLSLRGLQLLSLGLLVVFAVLLRRRIALRPPLLLPLLGLLAAQLIALALALDPARGISQVTLWAALVGVYWVSSAVDSDTLGQSVFAILASVALIALYQALNYLLRVDPTSLPPRIGSTLWNPNNLAVLMVVALALAVKYRRWFWLIVFLVALALTGSATSLVVSVLGSAVYAVLMRREIRISRAAWITAGVMAAGLLPVVITQLGRRAGRGVAHGTLGQRLHLWRVAILSFLDRPLTGIGPDGFKAVFLKIGRLKPGPSYHHAHNLYLHTAAETGLIGLAALGWLLVALGRRIWQAWQDGRKRGAALAAALLAALLAHGTFDYVYWIPSTLLIMLWAGRVLLEVPDTPAAQPAPAIGERLRQGLPVAQTILIGLAAFRMAGHIDHIYAALARGITTLSLLLGILLFVAIPLRDHPLLRGGPATPEDRTT